MAVRIVMPKLGMVMSEGTVARWVKPAGEQVSQGEVIAEIETEKINYDLEATGSGILNTVVPEGAVVAVDAVIGYLLAEGEGVPEPEVPPTAPQRPVTPPPGERARIGAGRPGAADRRIRSTPGARKAAAQLGVDISQVPPSGPSGRVVENDVRAYAEGAAGKPSVPPGLPEPSKVVPLEGMRKTIADHMRGSIAGTAQLTFHMEVDVTEAQRLRKEASSDGESTITLANVITKACAEALIRYPELNTVLADGNILYFDQVNVGIAVALKEGLIVPVVHNVDKKSIFDISSETRRLAARAQDGKLLPDEVAGGTFTISVLGTVDGFTPILSAGQSAIIGVGRAAERPVVRGSEIVVREMTTLSLTVDHQVVDGSVAAAFLRRLQQMVERPKSLIT